MNKNLRKIIAMALAFGGISSLAPATDVNLLTTKAYASVGDISLTVEDEDGDDIDLEDEDGEDVDFNDTLDDGDTYYVETSSDTIKFKVQGAEGGSDHVKIFDEDAEDDDDGYSSSHEFSLDEDETFTIRVYDEDEEDDDVDDATYGDDDLDYEEYEVEVDYTGDDDDDDDDDENDYDEFDSLDLLNKNDDSIQLYEDSSYNDDIDGDGLDKDTTYYAKTSSNKVSFEVDGDVDDEYIRVFKSILGSGKGYDIDSEFEVTSDKTFIIRIYSEEPDDDVTYDDDDNVIGEYKIKLHYTGSSSAEDNADDYDEIYLEKLAVDGENITLSDDKVAYSYNVPNSTKEVYIKALPQDDDEDEVTIGGDEVDEDDSWKKTVSLNEGANKFEIEVENDDNDSRTYTLTINRAKAAVNTNTGTTQPSTGTTQPGTGTTPAATTKVGWVLVNGRWQYFDSFGKQYKSQWLFDRTYGKWYYLGADGNMYIGWLYDGGKFYYLNTDGSMAANTTINGFKVGPDGAWIVQK